MEDFLKESAERFDEELAPPYKAVDYFYSPKIKAFLRQEQIAFALKVLEEMRKMDTDTKYAVDQYTFVLSRLSQPNH